MLSNYETRGLALDAALALDISTRREVNNRYTPKIAELSEELAKIQKRYKSPMEYVILSRFFWPNEEERKRKHIDEVNLQLHLFRKDLIEATGTGIEKQKRIKRACINLSEIYFAFQNQFRYGLVA